MKKFAAGCQAFFLGLAPTLCIFAAVWGCFTVWVNGQSAFMPNTVPLAVEQVSLWEYELTVFGEKSRFTLPELPGKTFFSQYPALIPRELRLLAFVLGEAETYLSQVSY